MQVFQKVFRCSESASRSRVCSGAEICRCIQEVPESCCGGLELKQCYTHVIIPKAKSDASSAKNLAAALQFTV